MLASGTTCDRGESCCSGACKDLTSDTQNCGACGTVCEDGQQCIDGTCTTIRVCNKDNCLEYGEGADCPCTKCSNIPADVYFLADNTGSMGGILGAVQAGAKDILDALQASPDVGDLHVGVGAYQDRGDPYVFNNIVSLTADTDAALAGIGTWTPGFGGDEPEGQLCALYKLSDPANPYGFRSGASKIIVWFGDAPGHNPICPDYAAPGEPSANVDLALVAARLSNADIKVIAISVGANRLDATNGVNGLGFCSESSPQPQQATVLTTATGGQLYTDIQTSNVVQVIIDSVKDAACSSSSARQGIAPARVARPVVVPAGTTPAAN